MLLAVHRTLTTEAISCLWVMAHSRHLAEEARDSGVQLIEYLAHNAARIPAHRDFSDGPQTKHLLKTSKSEAVQLTAIHTSAMDPDSAIRPFN